jgi:kinesin family protein 2/24
VTLFVPLANLFQASLAAKEYALKRQKMRQKAETIRFERMNQERKSAEEKKNREQKERQRALELTKRREEFVRQKMMEREEREREKERRRVEERERKAKEAAMWSPRTQNVELGRYAQQQQQQQPSPKSPNDVFYDAKESLPAVQNRVSLVEKSSVGNANKVKSESMVGGGVEEELMRKKTKTLSIASERRREAKSKSPLSSSSGGGGGGVSKIARRPSMLSNTSVKKPFSSSSGSSSSFLKAKKSTPPSTSSPSTAPKFRNTMVNAKTGEIKSLRPPSFLASQSNKTAPSLINRVAMRTPGSSNSATLAKKKKKILTDTPSSAETDEKDDEEEKSLRQMFDKRESRRIHAKQFKAAVQRWRMKNVKGYTFDAKTSSSDTTKMISVYARKRPLFERETSKGEFDVVTVGASKPNEIVVHNCQMHADLKRMFVKHGTFSLHGRAFDEDVEEIEVYETAVKPLVENVIETDGGSAALFMFGQTGSGKTHTMSNIELNAFKNLFTSGNGVEKVCVQYFEIQGKKCFDLLGAERNEVILKEIFETKRTAKGNNNKVKNASMEVELINATSVECFSAEDVEKCVKEGVSRRTVSATQCNAQSSRSHAVLRLTVHKSSMVMNDDGEDIGPSSVSERRLTLVDCAGSERKEDNVHHDAKQREETAAINASLYALKECARFRKLRADAKDPSSIHVPYRNSPLTKVLAECFVSDVAKMAVIGTVSPASIDTEHTAMTLKTIVQIGGDNCEVDASSNSTSCYKESREDVERTLEIEISKVTGEKTVVKKDVARRIPPVKWKRDELERWIQTARNGMFKHAKVPTTIAGRELVRMQPAALSNMFGGDASMGKKLHESIRAEIQKCSVKTSGSAGVGN